MWRFCDLHNHTFPNETFTEAWDAVSFVRSCIDAELDVVAVTDHDICDRYEDVAEAAGDDLVVLPGVEIDTDRGHVLVIAPVDGGGDVIRELISRVGAGPGTQVDWHRLLAALGEENGSGHLFAALTVTVGAHVDMEGELLGSPNPLSVESQLEYAARLSAVEVARDDVFDDWLRNGVKQKSHLSLLRGSDTHDPSDRRALGTWLYLPEISPAAIQHALALPEASISYDLPPDPPKYVIQELEFSDGMHGEEVFKFDERTTCLIGPPNSGKSLIIDAIKFAFSIRCDLEEVEQITTQRMAKCLPPGTTVTVRVATPDGPATLVRTVGGAEEPVPPFKPIVFSQTELTRRAHEPRPSIRLLDPHSAGADQLVQQLNEIEDRAVVMFEDLITRANTIRSIMETIGNPEDGLATTKRRLEELAGTEDIAKLATASARVARWRETTRSEIERWRDQYEPTIPEIPVIPSGVASDDNLSPFVPGAALAERVSSFEAEARDLVSREVDAMLNALDEGSEAFEELKAEVRDQLTAAGFEEGTELETELKRLRDRLHELEDLDEDREVQHAALNEGLADIRNAIDAAADFRAELLQIRKSACTLVNDSMHTFFAVVDGDGETERIDALIDHLKTGTYMRPEARRQLQRDLDRPGLLETAVRIAQGATESADESDQDRLVEEAMERGLHADLARLAVMWPGDALDLRMKASQGEPPITFSELTEGLRALAIKEISFAASDLPVITDQPEDAVPTRAVFDSLVPTLRQQRSSRQFVVVSHDANIVVASDVESVTALQANADGSSHTATLFDKRIRDLALEHLEGGSEAFDRRAALYHRPVPAVTA